jgi:hypothetical protein
MLARTKRIAALNLSLAEKRENKAGCAKHFAHHQFKSTLSWQSVSLNWANMWFIPHGLKKS